MKSVVLRPRAERDLGEIQRWYGREQPGLDLDFMAHFEELLRVIAMHPRIYARLEKDIHRARRIGPFPYSVYYREVEERIIVLTIVHNSRHPDAWRRL